MHLETRVSCFNYGKAEGGVCFPLCFLIFLFPFPSKSCDKPFLSWKALLTYSNKFSFNFTLGHTRSEERRARERRESKKVQAAAQKPLSLLSHRLG